MTLFLEENAGYDSFMDSKENIPQNCDNEIIQTIDTSITNKQSIWISYNGGSNPLIPRQIKPIRWGNGKKKFSAYCHQSQSNKFFIAKKIKEIKKACWDIEKLEATSL